MVGQTRLKREIQTLMDNNSFPRFSIIIGDVGSGRKTLAMEIASELHVPSILWEGNMENIRYMQNYLSEQNSPCMFIIPEYEQMNYRVPGALLKLCEETPDGTYIVITAQSRESILDTILNRGYVFEMDEYTFDDLQSLSQDKNVLSLISVPGDIKILENADTKAFINFCDKFIANAGVASSGNILKVAKQLNIKGSGMYSTRLFINYIYNNMYKIKDLHKRSLGYGSIVSAREALRRGYNPTFIIDMLLLELREVFNEAI